MPVVDSGGPDPRSRAPSWAGVASSRSVPAGAAGLARGPPDATRPAELVPIASRRREAARADAACRRSRRSRRDRPQALVHPGLPPVGLAFSHTPTRRGSAARHDGPLISTKSAPVPSGTLLWKDLANALARKATPFNKPDKGVGRQDQGVSAYPFLTNTFNPTSRGLGQQHDWQLDKKGRTHRRPRGATI